VNGSNDSLLQAVESYGFGYTHLVLTCAPRADSHGMRLEIWGPGICAQQPTSLLQSKKMPPDLVPDRISSMPLLCTLPAMLIDQQYSQCVMCR